MNDFDIPIFKKAYDLYKTFYEYRANTNKQDRYTIWQRSENIILEIIEGILLASQGYKEKKMPTLKQISLKINLLRVLIRLMKEIKTIDNRKYVILEESVNDIGRMLGGWIKFTSEK